MADWQTVIVGIVVALLALRLLVFNSGTPKQKIEQPTKKILPIPSEPISHKKKEYLCTDNEKKLFFSLRKALDDKYLLHCQTSLIALVEPLHFKDKSKAWSKRMDFVITDTASRIIAVIELDDSSHHQPKRIARDKYVNDALNPHHAFIRIATKKFYEPSEVADILETKAGIPNRFKEGATIQSIGSIM